MTTYNASNNNEVGRARVQGTEPLSDKNDGTHPRRPAAAPRSNNSDSAPDKEPQLPVNYDFPFNVPSLLVPVLPTRELQQRYFPVQKRTSSKPSQSSSKPESFAEAMRRAERMTEYSNLPTNYDFPFGIPSLLIDTYSPFEIDLRNRKPSPPKNARNEKPQSSSSKRLPNRRGSERGIAETAATAGSTTANISGKSDLRSPQPSPPADARNGNRPSSSSDGESGKPRKLSKKERIPAKPEPSASTGFTTANIFGETDVSIYEAPLAPEPQHRSLLAREVGQGPTRLKPIHVLASNLQSTYIAHSLSRVEQLPPVTLLVPGREQRAWFREGQQIRLMRGSDLISSGTLAAEGLYPRGGSGEGHIGQLVVTARAGRVVKELAPLVPRIDNRTVICLVQDALGLPEFLNERLFQNAESRPLYVLGHMTHLPRHIRDGSDFYRFAIGEEPEMGRLYLTALLGEVDQFATLQKYPPPNFVGPHEHFLYGMSTDRKLNVQLVPMGRFLQLKLTKLMFLAAVDSTVAMLDCEYSELARLESGLELVEQMLDEIRNVIAKLPELETNPQFRSYAENRYLRGEIVGRLRSLSPSRNSELRSYVSSGSDLDIEHTAGWFVRRGRDLGLKLPTTWSVMESVKAKAKLIRKRNQDAIKFQP
ncbi:hypothetical protein PgNI_10663 [Pyricularia grisea]|uniref:Ketopantoate reductase C-terminal domain-containing protein n=1 Tax=Pyricularia grisea TaxID=148305 RepID=A0A6P8AYZ7_PYRGI|nr:hypothetical protein PgNI_10663 [Pyricularia grisea]TLD07598.1 hypothetical protein PgNI_10663 [Pyricularia grisea]